MSSPQVPVAISGLGQISALGQGMAALESGINGGLRPNIIRRKVKTRDGEWEVPVYVAPAVVLPDKVPESIKRRMARITKMCSITMREAVLDAFGVADEEAFAAHPTRVGIVVGTAFGCMELAGSYQRRLLLEGPTGASPTLFSASIQNSIASHLSISFGVLGPIATVSTMEQTTVGAMRLAYDWLQQDVVDHVIVTVGDELSEYQPYALAHRGPEIAQHMNVESDQCTAVAGEGMVSLVLSRADQLARLARRYCAVSQVQIYSPRCPPAERYLTAAYGAEGQWSRYKRWTSAVPLCHASLYGSMVTGMAFEVAIGAHLVSKDQCPTACVLLTERDEAQAVTLLASPKVHT